MRCCERKVNEYMLDHFTERQAQEAFRERQLSTPIRECGGPEPCKIKGALGQESKSTAS